MSRHDSPTLAGARSAPCLLADDASSRGSAILMSAGACRRWAGDKPASRRAPDNHHIARHTRRDALVMGRRFILIGDASV